MTLQALQEPAVGPKATAPLSQADKMKRRTYWVVLGMLSVAFLTVSLGIYSSTRTENVHITGHISGIIFVFGSILSVLGLCLEGNRRQLLTASIFFLSLGIIASSICIVVDGVYILTSIDTRPLWAGRCQFYTSGHGYVYENHFTSVPCQGLMESCTLMVKSGSCYCCDLYDCANGGYLNKVYEFIGVESCQGVLFVYYLMCGVSGLNLLALILGLLSASMLGNIKALRRTPISHRDTSGSMDRTCANTDTPDSEELKWTMGDIVTATAPPLPGATEENIPLLPQDVVRHQPAGEANQFLNSKTSQCMATMGTSAASEKLKHCPPAFAPFCSQ
ncbi:transmembrane protein 255B-like [Chanos chanos]|uniref:Transmembrane protein 255B-like n=1 Tax=Chanos chanos TaxID=29144 RepID=A0A6J2VFA6_CHACN|nr:transmembrane protein 255B-like [Chanos chanos]